MSADPKARVLTENGPGDGPDLDIVLSDLSCQRSPSQGLEVEKSMGDLRNYSEFMGQVMAYPSKPNRWQ